MVMSRPKLAQTRPMPGKRICRLYRSRELSISGLALSADPEVGQKILQELYLGLGPALRATRPDLAASLRTSSQRAGRVRGFASQALLAAEVAASLVLLVSAGLLLRTLYNFSRVDVGFNASNVLVFRMDPPAQGDSASRLFDGFEETKNGCSKRGSQ